MLSSAARSFSAAALRRARVPAHTSVRFSGAAASAPFRGRAVAPVSATARGAAAAAPAPAPYPPLRVTAPGRVVALGDVHGDIGQARRALRIAGVLGDGGDAVNPEWVGGNTVVVQVGDVLDRGDDEIAILILLQKLHKQARQSGGAVYILNGNHEVLNVSGDFRYVTQGAFQESTRFGEHLGNLFGKPFEDAFGGGETDPRKKQVKARAGLFSPGGPLAQQLAMNSTVLIVNDTVFAHGGLMPRHVEFGLEKLNNAVADWMRGAEIVDEADRTALGMAIGSVKDSVVWNRTFGTENFVTPSDRERACDVLGKTLDLLPGVKRMVVGHTPQLSGCNDECDGRIWRIDVGMSFGVVGADPEVLEIMGDAVKVLNAKVPAANVLASKL
mmetsp:Transcript_6059/g.22904  ORF Transcript_6059/g.22904 Transcript_6059/m.22904 type:complete len:386 (+) Transcript_6059:189-1346(+)